MPTITLDQIRSAVEAKYEPVTIDLGEAGQVQLVQALRLPKERRTALSAKQAAFNEMQRQAEAAAETDDAIDDAEDRTLDHLEDMIRLIARSESEAELLLSVIDRDLATLMEVFTNYTEASELGEA